MKLKKSFRLLGLSLTIGILSLGSALAKQGGISGGGGGGVAPVDPAGPALIEQALREAPLALSLYFNHRETTEFRGTTPIGEILFGGPTTIHELLKNVPIETKGPCRDPQGKRRDGAAPGKRPGSICMHVKSLGRKLTEDNYWAQTVALAGHELSHLLGTNEREATELQTEILTRLRFNPNFKAVQERGGYLMKLDKLAPAIKAAAGKNGAWAEASMLADFLDGGRLSRGSGLQPPSPKALWLGQALKWKLDFLHWQLYLQGGGSSPSWEQSLKEAFWDRSESDLATLAQRLSESAVPPDLASLKFERLGTEGAYEREVASILAIYDELYTAANSGPPAWTPIIDKDYAKPAKNEIHWSTSEVTLDAKDLSIEVEGKKLAVDMKNLRLGGRSSIEATWTEAGKEMRLFIYLDSNSKEWWSTEIRTYDGAADGTWVYYYGDFFRSSRGKEFHGEVTLAGWNEEREVGVLRLHDLRLKYEPTR